MVIHLFLGKTGNLHLFFSVWKLNWTSKMRTLRTQFTEQALQNVHAAIHWHVHMPHVLYDLSKEVENTYVFNFLSPRNGDSSRPFWRLEMHQSTLVTARWLVSWFEASTWDVFFQQKCLLFWAYWHCLFYVSYLTVYWTLAHGEVCCRFGCLVASFVHTWLMLVACKYEKTFMYAYRFCKRQLLV